MALSSLPRVAAQGRRVRPARQLGNALYYLLAGALALVFLFPLVWTVIASFKPAAEGNLFPPSLWPSHISAENYRTLHDFGDGIWRYVGNSVLVAFITVFGATLLSLLAGYGFSRFQFPAKNVVFVVILATLMIPFQSILAPLFLIMRAIHLGDTLLGLALVYITFQMPFSVFMMRNAFDAVPREIEEAALIDGCSPPVMLWRVMLPLVMPGVVTVALFAFFASWNEFLAALIFMSSSDHYTLPVMLVNVQSGLYGSVDWGAVQAGVTITMLPCVLLFLLLQRYYVNGLTAGAVKG
ncbi:carbohydrate ABC transporter permease [Deinococcus sp.]|uniref:carbohydrate ABC transporter permease n=1 Tax=Deinococcus sp. TaxID=47478 RepID=UPI003C7DF3F7